MDAHRFDQLVRALSGAAPRRGLLRWLLAFLLSGLFAWSHRDDGDAKGRRKRRKKRHKHGKGRRRKHHKKQCKAHSRAKTCAGKCGAVKNNCKKTVNCGSCGCDEGGCPACQRCDDATRTCQPDPATVGDPCGEPIQVCQSDGTCTCPDTGCGGVCGCEAGFVCDSGACQPCDVVFDGDSVSSGAALQARLTIGGAFRVCPGRYQHNFVLSANVDLLGAGDGEDADTSTILDAAGSGRPLTVNETVTASLQGVRITGGNERLGGGILSDGRLTLTACTVSGNVASTGGGIYLSFLGTGPLALIDSRVTGNRASNNGGGIHINSVFTTTLSGSTVAENQSAQDGGGIFNNGSVLEITSTEISDNEAAGDGGGVTNARPVVTVDPEMTFDAACRITNNRAGVDGTGTGGGIFNDGIVTLNGAAVTDNEPNNCAGDHVAGCSEAP